RIADRAVLEQDLLLYELPVDVLPDRDRGADHGDEEHDQGDVEEQLPTDQAPEAAQRQPVGGREGRPLPGVEEPHRGDDGGGDDGEGEQPGNAGKRDIEVELEAADIDLGDARVALARGAGEDPLDSLDRA